MATGVSEKWLLVGNPEAPMLERDDVTPYTKASYENWRRKSLTASQCELSKSLLPEHSTTAATIDPRSVAGFATNVIRAIFAALEAGQGNVAVNDLWKYSRVMLLRYGTPGDMALSDQFTRDVVAQMWRVIDTEMHQRCLHP